MSRSHAPTGKFPMQNVTSAQWLPPRSGPESLIVAGVADGSLYVFRVRLGVCCWLRLGCCACVSVCVWRGVLVLGEGCV